MEIVWGVVSVVVSILVGAGFSNYNFVKRHNTLRCTPTMAAGVAGSMWSVGDLVEATA
jgi:hypothetical protein